MQRRNFLSLAGGAALAAGMPGLVQAAAPAKKIRQGLFGRTNFGQSKLTFDEMCAAAKTLGPGPAFGLAVALNFRPKGLLLSAAAGLSLRGQNLTPGQFTVVILIYTAISASAVAVPVIASVTHPVTMERRLIGARDWLAENNRIVSVVIMILIGTVIVGNGLAHL